MNHAAAETALVHEFQIHADILWEGGLASSHQNGMNEQVVLVHQPGLDRLCGKLWTADADVTARLRLDLADLFGVELSLPICRSWSLTKACTSSSGAAQSNLPCASSM